MPKFCPPLQLCIDLFSEFSDTLIITTPQTLKPSAKTLIIEMYHQQVRSPEDLISCIKFEFPEDAEDPDNSSIDPALATSFVLQFSWYLRGIGHPNHPRIMAVVSPDDIYAAQANPTFCCEQFLQQVSGSFLLPADRDQDIIVRCSILNQDIIADLMVRSEEHTSELQSRP